MSRERADVEIAIIRNLFFNATTRNIQTALNIALTPTGRGGDEDLLNIGQRVEGYRAKHFRVGGHFAPTCHA
ncbi:Uncharacterised protein [Vibrio cholerae]|nr:Uncharacterised protein [Vibrio cholerae]CSB84221.1 Uncharacterised protein [Vibrio cholerae]CSI81520.1 Uncharacterised protein [Vibrio cholerae]